MYALNARTGSLLWKSEISDIIRSSPTVADGVVYVGAYDGTVYALSVGAPSIAAKASRPESSTHPRSAALMPAQPAASKPAPAVKPGELLWRREVGGGVDSSPAVVDSVVYVGAYDSHMYALDTTSGWPKWKSKIGGNIESSPAVVDGVVYVGAYDGHVYALDATTGEVKWKCWIGSFWGLLSSSPAVVNGIVYIGSTDRHMYALNAANGEMIWKRKTGGMVKSSPTVATASCT